MGMLADQDGILRRYINEGYNWSEHLANTKQAIIDFIIKNKAKSVSILGSGWMLDIPVQYLAEKIEKILFYDIRHPRGIINKYERNKNFKFITADLSGGFVDIIYRFCQRKGSVEMSELEAELSCVELTLPLDTECYVSVNLLNQLDILLIDYLKKFVDMTDENILRIRGIIQQAHLNFLSRHKSCLITDYEEIHLNDDNEIIDYSPLIFTPLPEGMVKKTWIWQFDANKTYHTEHKTFMRVTAIYE
jgi:hypothetical protein